MLTLLKVLDSQPTDQYREIKDKRKEKTIAKGIPGVRLPKGKSKEMIIASHEEKKKKVIPEVTPGGRKFLVRFTLESTHLSSFLCFQGKKVTFGEEAGDNDE